MRSMPIIHRNGNESTFRQNIGNSIAFLIPANKNMQHMHVEASHIQHMHVEAKHTQHTHMHFDRAHACTTHACGAFA